MRRKRRTGDKRSTLRQAAHSVGEGSTLAFGGVTLYRRPMAFVLALQQRFAAEGAPKKLTLLNLTCGVESDLLVAAGMIRRVRTCYFGLEVFGLAPAYTAAAADGRIEIVEESEASIAYGLRASLAGVGFMPSPAWQGTDMLRLRPDVKTISDPYTDEPLTAFPALTCDVAVIHALEADPQGNARIGMNQGVDRELALVADRVIITTERLIPRLDQADIIGFLVDQVIEAPHGAWPTSCHPLYPLEGHEILAYIEAAEGATLPDLLSRWQKRILQA